MRKNEYACEFCYKNASHVRHCENCALAAINAKIGTVIKLLTDIYTKGVAK